MSGDRTAEQKGKNMSAPAPQERGITRRALLRGAAAAGGALVLSGAIDQARKVFGQPPPYRVELPVMMKGATKAPEIKQGMYGIWQKEIGFEQNGYTFTIENGEEAGLVVRNWQSLLELNEYYGKLNNYKSFTLHFMGEDQLSPAMKEDMITKGWSSLLYKDDPDSDQILFYRSSELKPGISRYGRYGNFIVYGTHHEGVYDASGNLHLHLSIALFNKEKYAGRVENFDPSDVLPQRITRTILASLLTAAKTNEEYNRLMSKYLGGSGPYLNKTADWDREYGALTREPFLFQVVL